MPYRVLNGLSYPPDKRAEVGAIIDDLPSKSVKWLLRKGHIEEVAGKPEAPAKPSPLSIHKPDPEEGDE